LIAPRNHPIPFLRSFFDRGLEVCHDSAKRAALLTGCNAHGVQREMDADKPQHGHRPTARKLPRHLWWLLVWSVSVLLSFGVLAQYSATPGPVGQPIDHWPSTTSIARGVDRATLIMFLHPHCPCSRASLEEFSRIIAQPADRLNSHIVFVRAGGQPPLWERTDLWSAAEVMPGVQVIIDVDGIEARRFGAVTSGSTLLFDHAGARLFFGGITGARGHAGDNPGKSAVLSALHGGRAEPNETPVFGCPLFDPPMGSREDFTSWHS